MSTEDRAQPVRRWRSSELLAPTPDGRFRRMVVQEKRLRSGTLSFAPDELVPEHMHGESDEIYYVISGSASIMIAEHIFDANPGDLFFIAAGERHAIHVAGPPSEAFVILAFVAPNLDHREVVFLQEPFPIPPGWR